MSTDWRSLRLPIPLWVAVYIGVNLGMLIYNMRFSTLNGDWTLWSKLPAALADGSVYELSPLPFVWSPVAAWIMAGVTYLGYWTWVAIHVGAVFLMRDRFIIALTLIAWPFWIDAAQGNVVTFVLVTGFIALRGGPTLPYLLLCLLVPRPVQAPLALWLLWKRPQSRIPFAIAFVIHAALVLWSGYLPDWIRASTEFAASDIAADFTLGPTALFGQAWLIVGIPLGLWLLWRGRVGYAGWSVSPYLLEIYALVGLWEVRGPRHRPLEQRSHDNNP